jgi:hypothetical protein
MIPGHLQRWPSTAARQSLAARFGLPYDARMQDWEWEVAEPSRFPDFLAGYQGGRLTDDERFSLMQVLLQSLADMELPDAEASPAWRAVARLLRAEPALHAATMAYWSGLSSPGQWPQLAGAIRRLWSELQARIAEPAAVAGTLKANS